MTSSVSSPQNATLFELLETRASLQAGQSLFRFIEDGEGEEAVLTYDQLAQRARRIGAALQQSATMGERAMLLYPPGLDYIAGFFGCLAAGVVAVPAYPPDPSRLGRTLPTLRAIIQDAQAHVVLTTSAILSMAEFLFEQAPELKALRWVATDTLEEGSEATWRRPELKPDTLAFLQYTSGSTGTPKGVMLDHSNLLHNLSMISRAFQLREGSSAVIWLPPYHDMGLIGGILGSLHGGISTTLMSPLTFLRRPMLWLETLSRTGASFSGGPNFAFELCVRKSTPEERRAVDLSRWELAFCGAEPVRPESLERFVEAFAPSGFRPESFYPCYGLAEGTLFASGGNAGAAPKLLALDPLAMQEGRAVPAPGQVGARTLVACGKAPAEQRLVIVDTSSRRPCAPDQVGEIWLSGPSVARGYWHKPEETEQTFRAHLADGQGPFLRTGDLGFLSPDGELFITGRSKDVLIFRGRNHYPQDLELTAERSHPALRPGCGAAFSIGEEGEERLVLVQELDTRIGAEPDEVVAALRGAIAREHGLQLHAVALIPPGSIFKTSSGKIRRGSCKAAFLEDRLEAVHLWRLEQPAAPAPAPEPASPGTEAPPRTPGRREGELQAWLVVALAQATQTRPESIDIRQPFAQYGLDSIAGVQLTGELERWLGRKLPDTLVWDHPTIEALARHLAGSEAPSSKADVLSTGAEEPIAVVGIGCRFPGAGDVESFWRLLREGRDAIREIPPERWNWRDYYEPTAGTPGKMNTRWGGFLEDIDSFDPAFFNISPREAARMDPQQRLLLEVTWEALEDAGQPPEGLAGTKAGVFIGISSNDYGLLQLSSDIWADAYAGTGNALSIAANRISYLLDLRGPSLAVDTACSSSLVALHLACRSLRAGESTVALAGGVNVLLSPEISSNFSQGGFLAPDGRCKPFDASANGYTRSEGAGVVVLKPLSRALADGDRIYALIRGSAVNQDGRSNGLTAPNRQAQESVLREAYQRAGISPGQVRYVEAHGTGTALGDPIEVEALGAVLASGREPGNTCALGSVKSNIGHLEPAAGIAGLIKVSLALHHRELPASLHFHEPNPRIPFERLPLRVQQRLEPWPGPEGEEAFAGVSAFGFGGTNAHVVLQGPPPQARRPVDRTGTGGRATSSRARLLPLSARSPEALRALAQRYLELTGSEDAPALLERICYTASARRGHHSHRVALPFQSVSELKDALRAFLSGVDGTGPRTDRVAAGALPGLVFVFAGQGPRWAGVGPGLMEQEPVFREVLEQCDAILRPLTGWSLLDELRAEEGRSRLDEAEIAQPALVALQVGLAALWRSWGIEPEAVVGHSAGEIAAAHVAGALSLSQALHLAWHRGRITQRAPAGGRMALVRLSAADTALALRGYEGRLWIAAHNGPTSTVVSGEARAIEELVVGLEQRQIDARPLSAVGYASHCPWMEPPRVELEASLAELRPRATSLPMISTVTGLPVEGTSLTAEYWGRQLREPVLFAPAIEHLLQQGHARFVEVGPHPMLGTEVTRLLDGHARTGLVVASLRRGQDERSTLLSSLGALYVGGQDVRWSALFPSDTGLVRVPTYPWQRERCWLDFQGTRARAVQDTREGAPADWFHELQWQPASAAATGQEPAATRWLIFADSQGLGAELSLSLRQRGARADLVSLDETPAHPEALRRLLERMLAGEDPSDVRLIYLRGLDGAFTEESDAASLQQALERGPWPVVPLVQALLEPAPWRGSLRLWLVTRGAQAVGSTSQAVEPLQAMLWGLGRTLALEHPELWGGLVDLDPSAPREEQVRQLAGWLGASGGETQAAIRQGQPYVARLARMRMPAKPGSPPPLRPDASYLLTGGLGGLGGRVARWLVEHGARRLILMGRTRLPPRSTWREVDPDTDLGGMIRTVRELESLGASIHLAAVDVADEAALRAYLEEFQLEGWPEIRGVVHAAGVLADQSLSQLDTRTWDEVLRPKVMGGWLLHRMFAQRSLDFFVSFSSAASLLGSPGQASYGAANAFLDALAHHRQARGLPGQSLNWGPWSDVGLAARPDRGGRLALWGVESLAPGRAVEALGPALASRAAQVGVMDVRWPMLRQVMGARGVPPFLSQVVAEPEPREAVQADAPVPDAPRAREELLALDEAGRRSTVEAFLRGAAASVLGVAPSRISADEPLTSLGFDSIMALELRNRIQARWSLTLPIVALVRAPSLAGITEAVLESLPSGEARPQEEKPSTGEEHPHEARFPLSSAQQRVWLLEQFQPGSSIYNVAHALLLEGALDVPALERSLNEIVCRHDVLRTTFHVEDGLPFQRIAPERIQTLDVVDSSGLPEAALEAEVARRSEEEARRPFALDQGPLLRTTLLRLDERRHVLLLTMHHIISDGWSLGVLLREVAALYEAFHGGRPSPLPALPLRFADHVSQERKWLESEALEAQLGYWRRQLAEVPSALDLPTDRPRPAMQSFKGALHFFDLPAPLSQELQALAEREGATPYMVLLAAFQTLLHRYSGQEDLCVGSPIAARGRAELEGLIGMFVNTLVLRTRLSGDLHFRELLGRVREVALEAYAHQDVPFEKLVEVLQPTRDPSRAPLCQVMLVLRNMPLPAMELPGLRLSAREVDTGTAMFDLTLVLEQTPGGLRGTFNYDTALFDASTVARMAGHFRHLLEAIVSEPGARLSELSLLSADERRQVLVGWSGTSADFPREATLHQLIEAQVARTPEAPALCFEGSWLTYHQLDERANQFAWYLRSLGVGPEVRVAVRVERSLDMVVALLAILKAGGAYVPIDPHLPSSRQDFLLQDSRASVVLTQRHLRSTLPAFSGTTLCLDEDVPEVRGQPTHAPPSGVTADNLAYVIYTSGSTGMPKGSLITHHSLANMVTVEKHAYGIGPGSRMLQFASINFDLSVEEIFTTLAAGGTLQLLRPDQVVAGPELNTLLREASITHVSVTPGVLAATPSENLPALSTVIVGGEACTAELVSRWAPGRTFFNTYGLTETTVVSTLHACTADGRAPPIGRPLPNVDVYVLDENQRPVPVGVPGELCIGGLSLARGYLNRPDLTAERFLPNPFSATPGGRLYRTGDKVRWRTDGSLDYLGRIDFQVKLRGYRIELGEIESVVAQYPAVREATVVAREDVPGDKRLVAYVVAREGHTLEVPALRAFLGDKLPKYMVPSAFVALPTLPLNSNGKVDRRALPAPDGAEWKESFVAPRNALEQRLARMWEELLGVRPVGVRSNFFELGGHSLLAMRLQARLREETGKTVPVAALFQAPTVEELAAWLGQSSNPASALVPLKADGSRRPFFCVHPVGGSVLAYNDLARLLAPEQPLYGLQAPGLEGECEPLASIEELAAFHLEAVRSVQPAGPYLLGGWSLGGVVAFEMARQLEQRGERVALLALFDSSAPVLEAAPHETDPGRMMKLFAEGVMRVVTAQSGIQEPIPELEPEALLRWLLGVVQRGQVLGPEVGLEKLRALYRVFEHNHLAYGRYEPKPYGGSVTLLRASQSPAGVEASPDLGWGAVARGGIEQHVLPGDHNFFLRYPAVQGVAERLGACLERAQAADDQVQEETR
ncbi:amino acid adenylation domain-containing protein [Archangium violaceum]|uniref:non-ribosomal peptide synthetase/type I polyketide synthase n=1 Tax=Archangium violaceum TaxID=83451 RepID=UPI00194F3711|nr:non-ribosomal peptide synthetase/type I polyketide synthase [Archangium violaceum]QRO01345.1 amino acid adenylation domain-containing protein [Archangium violaceum]